jgi:carboxyl-terminal processing protease
MFMNRLVVTLVLLVCAGTSSFSQQEIRETDKLFHLAKVWGFMKYYHPQVAKGRYDWDQELLHLLPQVAAVQNREELSELFVDWIESLGKVKRCRTCKDRMVATFDKNFDLDWIADRSVFQPELIERLEEIKSNRHIGKKYYVTYEKGSRSEVEMINEKVYPEDTWTNAGVRLITLFRYWNFVAYFFPYQYQTDKPWDEVLRYFIPVFLDVETETEFHLALLELVASLDDSHGVFATDKTLAYFGNQFLPVSIKYIDEVGVVTGFYDDSLAAVNDFRLGDIITHIDGKALSTRYDSIQKYISGSNASRKKSRSFRYLFNGETDTAEIQFLRDGDRYVKTVRRYPYSAFKRSRKKSPTYEKLHPNIGYINMASLERTDVGAVFEQLISTQGLILDFRGGANNTWDLVIEYLSSEEKAFCTIIYPHLDYPGRYIINEPYTCGSDAPRKYPGTVVLLVNEDTQSHAEYSVMCLQTGDQVITLGNTTSGADGNTTTFALFDHYQTVITGTGVFYPDMTETQRKGIKIDYPVTPSVKGLSEGKDELLLKAIQVIEEEKVDEDK